MYGVYTYPCHVQIPTSYWRYGWNWHNARLYGCTAVRGAVSSDIPFVGVQCGVLMLGVGMTVDVQCSRDAKLDMCVAVRLLCMWKSDC